MLATSHSDGVAVLDARTLPRASCCPGRTRRLRARVLPGRHPARGGFTSGTSIVWDVARPAAGPHLPGAQPAGRGRRVRPDGASSTPCRATGSSWPGTSRVQAPSLRRDSSPTTRATRFQPYPSPDGRTVAYVEYWRGASRHHHEARAHPVPRRRVGSTDAASPPVWGGPSAAEWEWSPDSREFAFAGGVVNVPRPRPGRAQPPGVGRHDGVADPHRGRGRGGPGDVHRRRQADGPRLTGGRQGHDRGPPRPSDRSGLPSASGTWSTSLWAGPGRPQALPAARR